MFFIMFKMMQCMYLVQYVLSVNEGLAQASLDSGPFPFRYHCSQSEYMYVFHHVQDDGGTWYSMR